MKVGILTHYDVNNLGAQLQMYASYHWLKEQGHTPVVLTYNKNFDYEYEQKLRNHITIKSVPYILREFLWKKGIKQTWHNTVKFLKNKKFREKNFNFEFYANSDCDVAFIGADEVLSIPLGVNTMMYGFGIRTGNCIAYAPSFGETTKADLEKRHVTALVVAGLQQFVALSARDAHTATLMEELTNKVPTKVCDPVILYDFSQIRMAMKSIPKKYLAIYSYDRNMIDASEIRAIRAYASQNALRTVSIGNFHKWCDSNITCDCIEWLEYMRQAECIITDTFHGAVVSTILHKEVAIMHRGININKMTALLQDTSMQSRKISEITLAELERVFAQKTDFKPVDEMLEQARIKSNKYLMLALAACKVDKG